MLKDQNTLLKKIAAYLEFNLKDAVNDIDLANRKEVLQYFAKSGGECAGLSTLWLYGKRLEENVQNAKPIDDIHFVRKIDKILRNWDEKSDFSLATKVDIEHFIANIIFYQEQVNKDFDVLKTQHKYNLIEDTKGRKLTLNLVENIITDKEGLTSKIKQLIQPQSLIFLGSFKGISGHSMGLYQDSKQQIHFYDPNLGEYTYNCKNVESLIDQIWCSANINNSRFGGIDPIQHILKQLEVRVFRFNDDPDVNYNLLIDPATNASNELMHFFSKYQSLIHKFGTDHPTIRDLIKNSDDISIIAALELPNITSQLKQLIIKTAILNINSYSCILAKYLKNNYADTLDILDKTKLITAADLQNLNLRLSSAINIDKICKYINDIDSLRGRIDLEDALHLLIFTPENEVLPEASQVKDLLSICNERETIKLYISIGAVACYLKGNNIAGAKGVIEGLAQFGFFPNNKHIEIWNQPEISEFIYNNYLEFYVPELAKYKNLINDAGYNKVINQIKDMMLLRSDDISIIAALELPNITSQLKQLIIKTAILNINSYSCILAKYLKNNYADTLDILDKTKLITAADLQNLNLRLSSAINIDKICKYINDIDSLRGRIDLEDALHLLIFTPENEVLPEASQVKDLLSICNERETIKLYISIGAVACYLKGNNIAGAKGVIEGLAQFGFFPNNEHIEIWNQPEISEFIMKLIGDGL